MNHIYKFTIGAVVVTSFVAIYPWTPYLYGNVMHPSIAKKQEKQAFDNNIARIKSAYKIESNDSKEILKIRFDKMKELQDYYDEANVKLEYEIVNECYEKMKR